MGRGGDRPLQQPLSAFGSFRSVHFRGFFRSFLTAYFLVVLNIPCLYSSLYRWTPALNTTKERLLLVGGEFLSIAGLQHFFYSQI